MNRDEQVQKLSRASDWRAALIILTSAFAEDGRVWQYVNLDREEIAFRKILEDGTFSSGEKMLLSIAASLFNREQHINLWEVFNRLDEPNTALVLRAIHSFCNEEEP
jgi:ABC-type multidrug transport system ATPase subunit